VRIDKASRTLLNKSGSTEIWGETIVKEKQDKIFAISAKRLIDGTGRILNDALVTFQHSKILEVGTKSEVAVPSDAEIINAHGATIMPGLIDAHIHFLGPSKGAPSPLSMLAAPRELRAIRGAVDATKYLDWGFTTVGEMGSKFGIAIKMAVEEGTIAGPKILAAGMPLTQTGGHLDVYKFLPRDLTDVMEAIIVDGVDEVRKAVRSQIRAGADIVKICVTGGVTDKGSIPSAAEFSVDEIKTAVDEAHRRGLKTQAHAQGNEGIKNAIKGGIDAIAHGFYLDDEACEMMIQKNIGFVPTLGIGEIVLQMGQEGGMPDYAIKKMKDAHSSHMLSFRMAYEKGVKIAMGTDMTGEDAFPHGKNAWELEVMVRQGMSNMDAIMASTKNASEILGVGESRGTLEEGKQADMLLIQGNPLEDIKVLQNRQNILLVVKDGRIEVRRGV